MYKIYKRNLDKTYFGTDILKFGNNFDPDKRYFYKDKLWEYIDNDNILEKLNIVKTFHSDSWWNSRSWCSNFHMYKYYVYDIKLNKEYDLLDDEYSKIKTQLCHIATLSEYNLVQIWVNLTCNMMVPGVLREYKFRYYYHMNTLEFKEFING